MPIHVIIMLNTRRIFFCWMNEFSGRPSICRLLNGFFVNAIRQCSNQENAVECIKVENSRIFITDKCAYEIWTQSVVMAVISGLLTAGNSRFFTVFNVSI